MKESITSGLILCIFGFIINSKPEIAWKITQFLNLKLDEEPSHTYCILLRVISGMFILLGILQMAGVI